MIERLPELVNGNEPLLRRGRFVSLDFLIGVDETPYYISVDEGRIASVDKGPILMRGCRFAIHAGAEDWSRFWRRHPAPGHHDIFAMTKSGAARIEGDWQPLMANLRYFKEVLAAPRQLARGA